MDSDNHEKIYFEDDDTCKICCDIRDKNAIDICC